MDHAALAVSSWVRRFAPLVPAGEVLDLACGAGRHARFFAGRGHPVLALDRDTDALAALAADAAVARLGAHAAPVTTMPFDLERTPDGADWPFAPARFAGIVVTNYLHRPLLARLAEALRPDGVLIYETFGAGNERFGKPSNPAFLLEEGELLRIPLRVLAYECGFTAQPRPAMVQRLAACGPGFARENAILSGDSGQE